MAGGWDVVAFEAVKQATVAKKFVPGLGHPVHKERDPRTLLLIRIAQQEGTRCPHLRLLEAKHFREIGSGRVMPLTVTRDVQMHTGSSPVPQKAA